VVIEKQTYRSEQCITQRKKSNEYGKTLASIKEMLSVHLAEYQLILHNKTKHFFDKAELYTKGIVQSQLFNI
jgi:hypothetical protein